MRDIYGLFLVSLVVLCCFLCGCWLAEEEDLTLPEPAPVVTPEEPDDMEGNEVITGEEAENIEVSTIFWISDSNVLHNSLCRWYQNCAGKEWDGSSEYTNCLTCGGNKPIVRRWNLPKAEDE